MNKDLSPAWQETDGNDHQPHGASEPKNAPAGTRVQIPVTASKVSRRPAAMVGIFLAAALGFTVMNGMDGFQAQIPGTPAKKLGTIIDIHITPEGGIEPKSVDVAPGQKVRFFNDQAIPHIMESETLLGENGSLLYTPAIFPGSSEEFTISTLQELGRHSYLSTTSVDVFGEINVIDPKNAAPAAQKPPLIPAMAEPSEPEPMEETFNEDPTEVMPDDQPGTIDSSDPLGSPASVTNPAGDESPGDLEALLPYNPYTVGSPTQHPSAANDPQHKGAPLIGRAGFKPYGNTETGPALWIVSILSIAALYWITRKAFSKI